MSKYEITDPTFGVWNDSDDIVDISSGTISDGYCNSSDDFFCPYCYFGETKIYNALPYFDEDGLLPKCKEHGMIDWNDIKVNIKIKEVERDIIKNRR